jgi:hypothetical protein
MKRVRILRATCLGLVISTGWAQAQDVDSELTMTLIPNAADLPEVVTRNIVLPEFASEEGIANSARGLATANENRAEAAANREAALMRAEQNRQAGAEIGEAAQANREDFVHGNVGLDLSMPDHLPELPTQAPDLTDLPGRPELPITPPTP